MDEEARESRSEMRTAVISAMMLGALGVGPTIPALEPRPKFLLDLLQRAGTLKERIVAEGALRRGESLSGQSSYKIDPYKVDIDRLSPATKIRIRQFWRGRKRLDPKLKRYWDGNLRKIGHGALLGAIAGGTIATTAFAAQDLARRRRKRKRRRKPQKK